MTRPARSTLALSMLLSTACATVPATVTSPRADNAPPQPKAEPTVAEVSIEPEVEVEVEPEPEPAALSPFPVSQFFDGELSLSMPGNLLAAHPFGTDYLRLEFKESAPRKPGRQIPGAWEGQVVRWQRRDPSAPVEARAEVQEAFASRPVYSLSPAGCDASKNECFVREASVEWIERAWNDGHQRALAVASIAATDEESGPPRVLLLTTVARAQYSYALLLEVHEDQWREHEATLREVALSFDAAELHP